MRVHAAVTIEDTGLNQFADVAREEIRRLLDAGRIDAFRHDDLQSALVTARLFLERAGTTTNPFDPNLTVVRQIRALVVEAVEAALSDTALRRRSA
jgi:hypothetical protein